MSRVFFGVCAAVVLLSGCQQERTYSAAEIQPYPFAASAAPVAYAQPQEIIGTRVVPTPMVETTAPDVTYVEEASIQTYAPEPLEQTYIAEPELAQPEPVYVLESQPSVYEAPAPMIETVEVQPTYTPLSVEDTVSYETINAEPVFISETGAVETSYVEEPAPMPYVQEPAAPSITIIEEQALPTGLQPGTGTYGSAF